MPCIDFIFLLDAYAGANSWTLTLYVAGCGRVWVQISVVLLQMAPNLTSLPCSIDTSPNHIASMIKRTYYSITLHYNNDKPQHYSTKPQHYSATLQYSRATLQYYRATLQYYSVTLQYYTTAPHYITKSLHYSYTTILHYHTTLQLHFCVTITKQYTLPYPYCTTLPLYSATLQ